MPPNPQNLKPPWPEGVSGNPKGRPPRKRQVDDLLQMMEETPGMERAISKAWMKQILAGSLPHLKEYLDRRDGKVPTPVEAIEAPVVDWSELNVKRDTQRPSAAANPRRLDAVPDGNDA